MAIEQREAPSGVSSAPHVLRTAPRRVLDLARRHPLVVLVLLLEVAVVTQMRNSAFQDEALYLSTGHWLLRDWTGGAPLTSAPADWFTGAPQLHPVLAALLDSVGGLGLARTGSTVFLLLTTVAVAWAAASVVRLLAPEAPETVSRSAAAAALVAASTGPLLALGHFATSDAASFACLAWALALGLHAARLDDDRRATRTALAVGALLALAVLLKYTSGLVVPFLLLAVLGAGHRTGPGPLGAPRRQALRVAVVAGGTGAALLLVSALTWARPLVTGFLNSTLERQPVMPATSADLAGQVLADAWLPLLLAAVGGAVLARHLPLVGLALGTGALAPVTAQVLMGENVSLYKASALGVVLGAVAAGTLVAAARAWWASALLVTALLVGSFVGASTAWRLAGNWPNSDALRAVVVPLVEERPGARVAGDNPEPMEYALWRTTDVAQWSPMYSGAFHRDGLVDAPAYEAAFAAREFDVVFFDGSSSVGRELAPTMADHGFQQVAQVATPDGGLTWTVWALPAGS